MNVPFALIAMPLSYNEKATTIAISLLKHKSPQTIQTLKNLLTFIPNPNHVKEILTTAVIDLIHTSPQSALWLFQHSEVLEPEIQVKDIIAQELTNEVLSWGYTLEDFHFTADHNLEISEGTKRSLLSHHSFSVDKASLMLIHALLTQ
jgi:hypothetical protein